MFSKELHRKAYCLFLFFQHYILEGALSGLPEVWVGVSQGRRNHRYQPPQTLECLRNEP